MTKKNLRLYVEPSVVDAAVDIDDEAQLAAPLLDAFARATGWTLRYVRGASAASGGAIWTSPVAASQDEAPRHLVLLGTQGTAGQRAHQAPPSEVRELVDQLAGVLSELRAGRLALKQREGELAAAVPVVEHQSEEQHLAQRLEAVLMGGAQAVDCDAAALYLLDETTSELKLRACWGLPASRFLEPARSLQESTADLEALGGHAVTMADAALVTYWKSPEAGFKSAVCVPVSSPTTPLGTLWLFGRKKREFSDRQVNLIEIIAGRLSADLERHVLLRESGRARDLARQVDAAVRMADQQLPVAAPLVDGWDVAAWRASGQLSGACYDWFLLPDGRLTLSLGDAGAGGVEGLALAGELSAVVKSHRGYGHDPATMLRRVNETLWTGSPGDRACSLFYAVIAPHSGHVTYSLAGSLAGQMRSSGGAAILDTTGPPLGGDDEAAFAQRELTIARGDTLIVATCSAARLAAGGEPSDGAPAQAIAQRAARTASRAEGLAGESPGVLVARRLA